MKRGILALAALFACGVMERGGAAEAPPSAATADARCARMLGATGLPNAIVTSAVRVAAEPNLNLPAFCEITAVLGPAQGSVITSIYRLPDNWNGKMLGLGGGGWSGQLALLPPRANVLTATSGLPRGYATAQTDAGHSSTNSADPGWVRGNPAAVTDFGHRAIHETAVLGKALVARYYGRASDHNYFMGCSTGGRMAMMESQRYPDDYDGIVAGALANRHIRMWAAGIASSVELMKHPEEMLSKEQAALVNNLVTNKCDVLHEGFLNDPRSCKVDFAELRCKAGAAGNACLTDAQLQTVETYYGGVKNAKGELIFSGQALGNPIPALQPNPNGPGGVFDLVKIAKNDPNADWRTFDLDREMKLLDDKLGYVDAVNPDLSKFKQRGGKLLLTHGWSDTGITPETSIWYYESVLSKMGPNQSDWLRLFMAPGMGHCSGGEGPDTFDKIGALEDWVEHGKAPQRIVAAHHSNGKVDRTRPLCAYPKVAKYKGSGSIDDAENFVCSTE